MNLEQATAFIQSHQSFYLAAHRSPDGDTLGSCLALRAALCAVGKDVTVVCPDPVPDYLSFLEGADTVRSDETLPVPPEAVIYVDCADHARTGWLQPILEQAPYQFCIDHHMTNPRRSKDGDWVENVGATGELIYVLLDVLGIRMTHGIAEALYTAIITDTGNFAYSNTTKDSLETAAKLLPYGIDVPELNRILFREMRIAKAKMIAYVLTNAQITPEGLGIVAIPKAVLVGCGATKYDCEGLIDHLRDIDVVEAACVLRESSDGTIRVSMRSKRYCDVAAIAQRFGGGGHQRAAGCTVELPLDAAFATLKDALTDALKSWKAS